MPPWREWSQVYLLFWRKEWIQEFNLSLSYQETGTTFTDSTDYKNKDTYASVKLR